MLKQFFAFALLTHCVICRFTPEVRQWQEGDERQNCTNICHKECIECKEPKYCTEDQVKCGEKTPENHPDCSADDICVPSDCLCPNNPDCTLKCHIECDDDEIKCEGGTDADGCEVNDYCHPKGTGTHGPCPGWCPEECDGVSCPNPNNPATGCPTKPTCKPKQENNQGNECPSQPCPVFCEITEIQCDGKIDHQGCKEGDTCVPKGSSNTEELCPGTCPVECGSDEILCKGQTDCDTGCVESDQCISKIKDSNGDYCPDDSASHGCPITCCDGDILCPAKTNAIGCKEKEQCTPRSKDNEKTLNCPREEGFCVLPNGGDQNSGVIKINNIDGNTIEAQEECLNQCHNVAGATGCEVIWNQGNRGCYAHTKQIDRGNNVGNHFCWVFSKCTGNNMDNYCPDHSDCPAVCQPDEVLCPIEGTEENGCDKPDVCIVQERDHTGELCPVHCPFECNVDEILCTGHRNEVGCEVPATCVKKARKQWGNSKGDLCPAVCPERCDHDEILCPSQFDPCDGCPTEQVCNKKHKNSNGEYCPDYSASHNCPKLCYETEVVGRPINDQVLCPVYEDAAGCKPEARCFHRSKDADDEWCPSTSVCPVQCQSNEIECSDGVDARGCTRENLCLPKGKDGDGNTCTRSCPKACAESQTFCEGSTLPNGCHGQGYCSETGCTGSNCVSWRQTGNCSSDGPREPHYDKSCSTIIDDGWSGWCDCSDGSKMMEKGCGKHEIYTTCNEACSAPTTNEGQCTFVKGDQTGGTYKQLGDTDTDNECAILVRNKENIANGASWRAYNNACFANFDSTGTDDNDEYSTCLFRATCDVTQFVDVDKGVTCEDTIGACTVLANRMNVYLTCTAYCNAQEMDCVDAWEESGDSCSIKSEQDCSHDFGSYTSDALCQCAVRSLSEGA